MMKNRSVGLLLSTVLAFGFLALSFSQAPLPPLTITVLYDGSPSAAGSSAGPGFACLVRGTEKTVLFETGGEDAGILLKNLAAAGLDPRDIDLFVVSRPQAGELGGLLAILAKKGAGQVFLPDPVPQPLRAKIEAAKGSVAPVTVPLSVCEGVFSTGQISGEQALVVDTPKGLVVVMGCGGAGVVEVVEKAKSVMPKDVYLVMGGFRFSGETEAVLSPIVRRLHELGVGNLGAAACTGEKAIALLKKDFGRNYIALGTGKTVTVPNPKS